MSVYKSHDESVCDVRTRQQQKKKKKTFLTNRFQKGSKSVLQCKLSFCCNIKCFLVKAVFAIGQRGYIQLQKLNYVIVTLKRRAAFNSSNWKSALWDISLFKHNMEENTVDWLWSRMASSLECKSITDNIWSITPTTTIPFLTSDQSILLAGWLMI